MQRELLYGYRLGFSKATVMQRRNPHDFMIDFESEIPMYLTANKIPDIVQKSISNSRNIKDKLYEAYSALLNEKIGILQSSLHFPTNL